MDNELLLLSKNDIPFLEAQVNIHQPEIREISLIGEEAFWSGCQFLNFSKDLVDVSGKVDLTTISDFEIFMSIMNAPEKKEYKNYALLVLTLIFPTAKIKVASNEILLAIDSTMARINVENFNSFKDILISMFGLEEVSGGGYNPADKRAAKIAEKFQKAKQKKDKNKSKKVALLSRYVSILAVGENKDMNELMGYTVFQLKDEFKRFQKKQAYEIYVQAKMAGAQDLEEVDNWMDDIHP